MIRITLIGALGRMGRELIALAKTQADLQIITGVEQSGHAMVDQRFEEILITDNITASIGKTDCVVDFSTPRATLANLRQCGKAGIPWVIGTTGFSEGEQAEVSSYGKSFALLFSPNTSMGINLMFELVKTAARHLPKGYDVEIVEMHHRHKNDAPSGTAMKLAEIIREARSGHFVFGREGVLGPRKEEEIGIMALRGGDVVGEHTVIFAADGERLELKHAATSRKAFAQGVIQAVRFIVKQKPGRYSMADVISGQGGEG